MKTSSLACILFVLIISGDLAAAEPIFVPVKIDGPAHDPANHSYWFGPFSESASVADFDGDGDLDLAAGRNWYEAPDWKKHGTFRDGAQTNGPKRTTTASSRWTSTATDAPTWSVPDGCE